MVIYKLTPHINARPGVQNPSSKIQLRVTISLDQVVEMWMRLHHGGAINAERLADDAANTEQLSVGFI